MVFIPKLQEIKQRREELKITQRQLAKLCDIQPSFLNMIEKGNAKPGYDVFVNLFKVLDEQAEKATKHLKTASKVCSSRLFTLSKNATLDEAIKIMKLKNFSQIPIEEKQNCIGLVTENSILKYQLENENPDAKVTEAMEAPPPIIDWNQPITPRISDLLYDSRCLLVTSPEKLAKLLTKYNQEATVRVDPNGDTSIDILDESKRKRIPKDKVGYNFPHVVGFPITYQEGDTVQTPDGRTGTVLGSVWLEDLTLYRHSNEPRIGYFLVKVDFGDHTELHIRNDLRGSRFRYL